MRMWMTKPRMKQKKTLKNRIKENFCLNHVHISGFNTLLIKIRLVSSALDILCKFFLQSLTPPFKTNLLVSVLVDLRSQWQCQLCNNVKCRCGVVSIECVSAR